jgi:arylsulfatase A-like enzyme
MVEAMDLAVGKVLAKLDELDLAKNTLVIFTSDNGGLSTSEGWPTSNVPLRGGKGWLYEGGIREPFLVRWPTAVAAQSKISEPISSPDVFATVLDVTRATLPEDEAIDGVSLLPVLKGQSLPDRSLFWHYPHYGNQGGAPGAAIRHGDWKLIHWMENDEIELFNLSQDVGEQDNIAAKHPEIVNGLRTELSAWQKDVGAKYPEPNAAYDPDKPNGRAAARLGGQTEKKAPTGKSKRGTKE